MRISKRLYVPYNKLRGFEKGKVGPKDGNDYIGGNYVSTLNLAQPYHKYYLHFKILIFHILLIWVMFGVLIMMPL